MKKIKCSKSGCNNLAEVNVRMVNPDFSKTPFCLGCSDKIKEEYKPMILELHELEQPKIDEDVRNAFILACFGLLPLFFLCVKAFLELLLSLGVLQ